MRLENREYLLVFCTLLLETDSLNLELGWLSGYPSASPFFPPHSAKGTGGYSQVFIWVLWLLLCRKCSYPLNHVPCPTNRILQLYKIFYTSSLKRTRKRIKLRPSNNLMPAPPLFECLLLQNAHCPKTCYVV